MTNSTDLQQRQDALLLKTAEFCDAHLNAEYKKLCAKVIKQLAQNKFTTFGGDLNSWAAAIIHALGTTNFLFDKSSKPHIRAKDIAEIFGVKPNNSGQKSTNIRFWLGMDHLESEFATKATRKQQDELKNMMVETIGALLPGVSLDEIRAEMPHFGQRLSSEKEFIDRDRPVMHQFYALNERAGRGVSAPQLEAALRRLIADDPDFFDSYAMLGELLLDLDRDDESDALLEEAFQRALKVITNKKGDWPQRLEWGWLENRHIIRALHAKAQTLWENDENEAALDLFRKLLQTNPNDNLGVRYSILAIHLGMSVDDFEAKFNRGGYYDSALPAWFDKRMVEFPTEFAAWLAAVEDDGE